MPQEERYLFSETELAKALFPWGVVEEIERRPFDHRACVERYAAALPRRAGTTSHAWKDRFTADLSGTRGIVSREEAAFWFWVATNPDRLDDDRDTAATVPAAEQWTMPEVDAEVVGRRFTDWFLAFDDRYKSTRFYSQAYLARLMLELVDLADVVDVLFQALPAKWMSSFLDELFPVETDEKRLAHTAAGHCAGLHYLQSNAGWNSPTRDAIANRNVAERLLPLARPQAEVRRYLDAASEGGTKITASTYHVLNALDDDEAFFEYLDALRPDLGRREVVLLVARFGLEGLDWLTTKIIRLRREPDVGLVGALANIESPRVVDPLLRLATRATTAQEALQALQSPSPATVAGLLDAVDSRAKTRDLAAELLAKLSRQHGALIDEVAAERGDEGIRERVADVVEKATVTSLPPLPKALRPDWMHAIAADDGKPTGLPRFASAKYLEPLHLRGGEHEVPADVVWGMLARLRDHDFHDEPRAFSEEVVEALDPDVAAHFFWSLFQSWAYDGFPSKYAWALWVLGQFTTDDLTLRLADLIAEWPTIGQRHAAYDGLIVLQHQGTDTALSALNTIARSSRFKALRRRAENALTKLATRRGLDTWQLEDMIIDDCGLDEDGWARFDYGPRQFRLAFDEDLSPIVRDVDSGKTTKSLPRKRKSDDQDLVAAEKQRYKVIKKRLKDVFKLQRRRLETALGDRRRWSGDSFVELFVNHPVMTHIVQRFVWAIYDGDRPARTFRVTGERELADLDDEEFDLGSQHAVGLLHPLETDDETIAAWGSILADYEVVPPWPQLDRPTFESDAGQPNTDEFDGVALSPGWLRGHMNRRGWSKSPPEDGIMLSVYRDFPFDSLRVYAWLDPGLKIDYRDDDDQYVRWVSFVRRDGRGESAPLRLADVPEVVLSEAFYDLHLIVDKARE